MVTPFRGSTCLTVGVVRQGLDSTPRGNEREVGRGTVTVRQGREETVEVDGRVWVGHRGGVEGLRGFDSSGVSGQGLDL